MQTGAQKTSVLLRQVLADLDGDKTPLEHLLSRLGQRSFGGILIMLSALAIIPGVSVITGLLIVLIGMQMLLGQGYPRLPELIQGFELETTNLQTFGEKVARQIEWIERSVRPRWTLFAQPPMTRLIAVSIVVLGLVMLIPLPFTNFGPAIAVLVIAVGQLERDGLVVAAGLALGIIAVAVAAFALAVIIVGVKGVLA